ncbi:hypothetical protein GCM10020219_000990 [Nonomuraea dietziae]
MKVAPMVAFTRPEIERCCVGSATRVDAAVKPGIARPNPRASRPKDAEISQRLSARASSAGDAGAEQAQDRPAERRNRAALHRDEYQPGGEQ